MINVDDDYGENDEGVGFSDDGDNNEQEWIDRILVIFFLWSILVFKLDILYLTIFKWHLITLNLLN